MGYMILVTGGAGFIGSHVVGTARGYTGPTITVPTAAFFNA